MKRSSPHHARPDLIRRRSRVIGVPTAPVLREIARKQKAVFVRATTLSIRKVDQRLQ